MHLKKYFLNLTEPEILVSILVILSVCIMMTAIFRQRIPDFKNKYKSKFNSYVFVIIIINALLSFVGYNKLFTDDVQLEFAFYQLGSLCLGSLHCYMYQAFFKKFGNQVRGLEYFFVLLIMGYSIIPFVLIYTFLNGSKFVFLMVGQYVLFLLPTLLNETFNRAMAIPPKIYKTWHFPENYKNLPGVTDEEMKDLVVFTLLIDKDRNAKNYSAYKAKGPTRIDFGRLFYSFILDYNDKHPESEIKVEGENGFYNWVFFLRPKWYESTKYVDADLPLYMNGIDENCVVICARAQHMIISEVENDQQPDFEYKEENMVN
ncbi:TssN family type VI secretion system protein [Chryseobacterium sp. CBSDS_008]|uniref:TssN family type VI secretion system protein n=1 Tax=Chryseobacterium sp. CBSDS_008 TaxID=3415265 RepID=UPI003CF70448